VLWKDDWVRVVTMDTREGSYFRLGPDKSGPFVANAGAGQRWYSHVTKVLAMREWIRREQLPPHAIVAFVDGRDVIYGGCRVVEFVARYEKIVANSGARIVFGAEFNCFSPPAVGCEAFQQRHREAVLRASGLTAASVDRWAEREGDELRFLNSGFYMGPAGLLLHLFDTAFYLSKQNPRGSNDQQYYADVMQQFGDLVTLDYAMVLSSTLPTHACTPRMAKR